MKKCKEFEIIFYTLHTTSQNPGPDQPADKAKCQGLRSKGGQLRTKMSERGAYKTQNDWSPLTL